MQHSLRLLSLRLGPLAASAVLGLVMGACGSITVPGEGTNDCTSDDDCQSSKFCRVGSCDTESGQCTFTVTSGSCFVGGECFQSGQEKPGDRCSVCTPALITTDFVARSCPAGQSCAASSGQCLVDGSDAVDDTVADAAADTAADGGPDATPDATPDGTSDVDAGSDCTSDGDCATLLGPTGCQTAICIVASGECLLIDLPEGSACTPASGATNPCVKGLCDAEGECAVQQLSNTACDDGKACTVGDLCVDGTCLGTAVKCDDGKACTVDVCDPATGTCSSQPFPDAANVPCDDGNACTADDTCVGGSCKGGANGCACTSDTDCVDDGNLCNGTPTCVDSGGVKVCEIDSATVVTCDTSGDTACEKTSCDSDTGACEVANLVDSACDDGDSCTFADKCGADGKCAGTTQVCNDDKVCTSDACVAGQCKFTALTGTACNPGTISDPACFKGQCSDVGECTAVPQTGIGCNDNNACTQDDKCQAGVCQGTAKVCDDGNVCTNDSCNAAGACVFAPVTAAVACDDGDSCTKDDACSAGACKGGASICQCTKDSDCVDDGNKCNGTPKCNANPDGSKACIVDPATIVTCSTAGDGPCEQTACAPATGVCAKTPKPSTAICDDGNACTTGDKCNGTGACTPGTAKVCDDSIACTADSCSPATGNCTFAPDPKVCDDKNPCTLDLCTATGCSNQAAGEFAPCDDGDSSTGSDFCFQSQCIGTFIASASANKCVSGEAIGLGIDGLGYYVGFSGTQGTGTLCVPGTKNTQISSLSSAGKLAALGGTVGASQTMDGLYSFGTGPLVGEVSPSAGTATWGGDHQVAFDEVVTAFYNPAFVAATGPVQLIGGFDAKGKVGAAVICAKPSGLVKADPVCALVPTTLAGSAVSPVAGAAQLTLQKDSTYSYMFGFVSVLGGKLSAIGATVTSASTTGFVPTKPLTPWDQLEWATSAPTPRGAVFHDSKFYFFGDSELLMQCGTKGCTPMGGLKEQKVHLVDAWRYSSGTVFLASDIEKPDNVSLFFLPKDKSGDGVGDFVRVFLPANNGAVPLFIEGGTTTGIYIVGTKGPSTSVPLWLIRLP